MKEQATKFSNLGLSSEFVGEGQTDPAAKRKVLEGVVQLVFINPDNILMNVNYHTMLLTPSYQEKLVALVVDEAHCVKLGKLFT